MTLKTEEWTVGDTYGPNDSEIFTAGIHIKTLAYTYMGVPFYDDHYNAVEFYGADCGATEARRNMVLEAIQKLQGI